MQKPEGLTELDQCLQTGVLHFDIGPLQNDIALVARILGELISTVPGQQAPQSFGERLPRMHLERIHSEAGVTHDPLREHGREPPR